MAAGLDAHNGILDSEDLVTLHNRSRQAAVALYRKLAIGGYQKEFDDELEVAALVSFAIRNTRDFVLSPSRRLHARASSWNPVRPWRMSVLPGSNTLRASSKRLWWRT